MRLAWSERARADLREIRAFSIRQWGGRVAIDYLASIRAAAREAALSPARLRPIKGRFHYCRAKSHYLVFALDFDENNATLARVLHVQMDIENHLPDPDHA